jgi:hypothetical protein
MLFILCSGTIISLQGEYKIPPPPLHCRSMEKLCCDPLVPIESESADATKFLVVLAFVHIFI